MSITTIAVGLLLIILVLAVTMDLHHHRIPNTLSFSAATLGLSSQAVLLGSDGLLAGCGGLLAGLLILLPFYALGGMGAGDVKLMAGIGTFLGPKGALLAGGMTLVAGGIMGLLVLMRHGGLGWFRYLLATGRFDYTFPISGGVSSIRFPYALAIAIGTLATLVWFAYQGGSPWMS